MAVLAIVAVRPGTPPSPGPVIVNLSTPTPEVTSDADANEVRTVHDALHDIGKRCRSGRIDRQQRAKAAADVDAILTFARRYPVGRFQIDDETSTAPGLLLVTRQALRSCDPALAARVAGAYSRRAAPGDQ